MYIGAWAPYKHLTGLARADKSTTWSTLLGSCSTLLLISKALINFTGFLLIYIYIYMASRQNPWSGIGPGHPYARGGAAALPVVLLVLAVACCCSCLRSVLDWCASAWGIGYSRDTQKRHITGILPYARPNGTAICRD